MIGKTVREWLAKYPHITQNARNRSSECDALFSTVDYCNFAYSALACFKMGMSGSASFQRVKKYWYAVWAFAEAPCTAYARARPRRASAPSGKFLTAPQ